MSIKCEECKQFNSCHPRGVGSVNTTALAATCPEFEEGADEFVRKIANLQFNKIPYEQIGAFCDKAIERNITIKDILFSIAILARRAEADYDRLAEHCVKGVHEKMIFDYLTTKKSKDDAKKN